MTFVLFELIFGAIAIIDNEFVFFLIDLVYLFIPTKHFHSSKFNS